MSEEIFELIKSIKNLVETDILFTNHSKIKLTDRCLEEKDIKDTILNKKVLDIVFQQDEKKKILFEFNQKHNLVIVVRFSKKNLKIITTHIISKKRTI